MREPAVAGMFYPENERHLLKELKACFKKGPGRWEPKNGPRIRGLVSPHAGYTYSGPTAAYGFLAAADGGLPETVVVIGPNHSGLGQEIGVSFEDHRTPLGIMKCDRKFVDAFRIRTDELSHMREHSMEVQLPFIQYFSKDIKQVSISLGHPEGNWNVGSSKDLQIRQAEKVSDMVIKAIEETGIEPLIVASSDLTHCGMNYGYSIPSGMNAGEFARSRDFPVIEKLLEKDLRGALDKKEELGTTACGMGPILAMMTTLMKRGDITADLLNYTTSYDVSPSHSAVGYGSIAIY
jgi:hypothetical protein